jgi:hypothetical protein
VREPRTEQVENTETSVGNCVTRDVQKLRLVVYHTGVCLHHVIFLPRLPGIVSCIFSLIVNSKPVNAMP